MSSHRGRATQGLDDLRNVHAASSMAMRHTPQGQIAMDPRGVNHAKSCFMARRAKSSPEEVIGSDFLPGVAARLHMLADVCELSQTKIAEIVHVDQSTVNKWLAGTRLPHVYQMTLLASYLNASLDFIYRGSLIGVRQDLAVALAANYPELVLGPDLPAKVKAPAS